jgi:hypothetical protein
MRILVKLALLLCCLPALMGAAVYRWVDDKGVINYSQQKPEGVNAERIDATSGRKMDEPAAPSPDASAQTPAQTAGAQAPDERLSPAQREALAGLQAAEQARQQEVANIREANCERARGVLERLNSTGRIRVRDADGNESVMSEDERQQRVAEAQRGVVENCVD